MEPITDLPESVDADADGDFKLVRVEYESGGEDIESVDVLDRKQWLGRGHDDDMWVKLAKQEISGHVVSDDEDLRLVAVELPGWWVEKEAEDADRTDTTWQSAYGEVYGEVTTLAAVDHEWSAGKAAWSFPYVQNERGRWVKPGQYGPGGPKSLLPIIYPVGTPTVTDAAEVRAKDARDAARESGEDIAYDWEAAVEQMEERVRERESMRDEELDISALETLDDQHVAAHRAAMQAWVEFSDDLEDALGVEPDPVTLTVAAEYIAQAVRERDDLEDPR